MEDFAGELKTFMNIWFTAIASICYCYFIPLRITHGAPRLLSLLPVITLFLFLILPHPISTVHFAFPTFFFLIWLTNFKLLLLAFNRGPLASTPLLPVTTFVCVALLPISPRIYKSTKNEPTVSSHKPILLAFKGVILFVIVHVVYHYSRRLEWNVMITLYSFYMYFAFEIGFAMCAFLVKIILGFDFQMEPQFDEPYLATSLQNFWGRRWNLMASSILRETVYNPLRVISTPYLGKLRGKMVAIFVTFVVSGLMHELMFWYMIRVPPTWEVTGFFVLHGVCTACEVLVKEAVVRGRLRLHRVVSGPVTVAFLIVTSRWLMFPQLIRNGFIAKAINEESSILLKICWLD